MPASPDQIPTDLTLEIGVNLSPDRFLAAARAFFGYVQELSDAAAPTGEGARWVVRVREGSALIGIEPSIQTPPAVVQAVYAKAKRGVQHLMERDLEEADLPEPALKYLRTLSEMTEAGPNKAAPVPIRLWVEKKPISLSPEIASTIRENWRADYNDYGTLEGRLETIQESYGSLQFFLRDPMLRQKVRCYFPEELLPQVFQHFRKRAEVSGVIHYRKNGVALSIEAEQIIRLPDDSELPTAGDVRGILST
jgi:hypothetical protein